MTDFIEELKKQRAEAQERLRLVQREVDAIDLLLAKAEGRDIPPPVIGRQDAGTVHVRVKRPPGEAKRKRKEIVEACRRHLVAASDPIRRIDLLALLQKDGVTIPSTDPRTYLSSLLWNHKDEIVNFYERGYWLADRPYPPLKFRGQKDEQHPLILTRQTGLKAMRDRIFHDGGDADDDGIPDDGRSD
jgi:hypothetical protein